LAKDLKPTLYFGALVGKTNQDYNVYSIEKCRKLSRILKLKFFVITITKKDYIDSFSGISKIIDEAIFDLDLPAVYFLFNKINEIQGNNISILSGIGMNELFNSGRRNLGEYLANKVPNEINAHKRIANFFNFNFYAPYLNKDFISYAFTVPFQERRDKASLKNKLVSLSILPSEYIMQPSYHSQIPFDYIDMLTVFISKKCKDIVNCKKNRINNINLALWLKKIYKRYIRASPAKV